jgi:hypothetical protein
MSLQVGQLCTVVYADGGVRVALPVDIATNGQLSYLSDFGLSGSGVPLRIPTIDEIAATVPEAPHDPRMRRVVGTVVRDASQSPVFVPLGVLPASIPQPTPASTFFVVFADTAPVETSFAQFPKAFFRRTPGEYDVERVFRPGFGSFNVFTYTTGAVDAVHIGGGYFREIVRSSPITRRTQTGSLDDREDVVTFNTSAAQLGAGITYRVTDGFVYTISTIYLMLTWNGVTSVDEVPRTFRAASRTFQATYDYFPVAVTRLRTALQAWTNLPPTLVYHLPLPEDAPAGMLNEIIPPGTIDTDPLTIIRGDYPTAGDVVARLSAAASEEGIREVRFITAMGTVGGAARVTALIAEIVGALEASYGQLVRSVTVAPENDWLGTLATSAENIPG